MVRASSQPANVAMVTEATPDQDDHPEAGLVIGGDFVCKTGAKLRIERRVLLEGGVYVHTRGGEPTDVYCRLVIFDAWNKSAERCRAR